MRLTATDIQGYYRPSLCSVRVYLRGHGEKETPPGSYDQVLERLGREHEKKHLVTLGVVADLSGGDLEERARRTLEEVAKGTPVIYQGVLQARASLDGLDCDVVGRPDFLIRVNGRDYVVRDSKMSRRLTEKDHPEILLELDLYGWLYEKTFGRAPAKLEVHCGTGAIVDVAYQGGMAALAILRQVVAYKVAATEPYSPVGWTKCGGCGYRDRCWPASESRRDVALVQGVDQGLAVALREAGITTYDQLLEGFDERRLAELKRPYGTTMRKVGTAAGSILRNARALASGKEIAIQPPAVPSFPNYVMFDLEGLPPQLDETERIYLWGMQVYGEKPSDYLASVAGFGSGGDRQGWEDFLGQAKRLFDNYGDVPFVHWHHYEKTHLDMYVKRFGDREGIAARIRGNLLDLLPITRESVALPLPSNSLKVVEKYVGFERKLAEYRGDTAMARFIEATETDDEKHRADVMGEILKYNCEDLAALWAVLQWLGSRGS
jgi:predicted RecB family nuclease